MIDWEVIREVISQPFGNTQLATWDIEDVLRLSQAAIDLWLEDDLKGELVYRETKFTIKEKLPPVAGIIDLGLKFGSELRIIDWKTSRNTLDVNWQQRLIDSFQWRIYAAVTGATRVIYRGINRKTPVETRELTIEVPPSNRDEVIEALKGFYAMRNGLVEQGLTVWPRNGKSCYAFGRQCPNYSDCQGYSMPKGIPTGLHEVSHSQLEEFLLCPERYRRSQLIGIGEREDTEESAFGKATHLALAEAYRQGFTT